MMKVTFLGINRWWKSDSSLTGQWRMLGSCLEGNWGLCIVMVSAWKIPSRESKRGFPSRLASKPHEPWDYKSAAFIHGSLVWVWGLRYRSSWLYSESWPTELSPEPGRKVFKGKLPCCLLFELIMVFVYIKNQPNVPFWRYVSPFSLEEKIGTILVFSEV